MISIITGSLILSLLHAVIPNHWLPVIAIGRKEQWTLREVTQITLVCALAHGLSRSSLNNFCASLSVSAIYTLPHLLYKPELKTQRARIRPYKSLTPGLGRSQREWQNHHKAIPFLPLNVRCLCLNLLTF